MLSFMDKRVSEATDNTHDLPDSAGAVLSPLGPLKLHIFRRWYWFLVPLLAIAAYATVLRIGFLGDDSILIAQTQDRHLTLDSLLPQPGGFLYRPLGLLFIWDLGALLWGNNPFPLHLQGLLFHAFTSLALALWVAEVTSRRALGWLAGSLFAVFPLHLEAVGWVAAQWDALSALFGITGLWVFSVWWRRGRLFLYPLSLLLYLLALFTKDSLITFVPLFALSAWLITPNLGRKALFRLIYALLPFCGVLVLNLSLRLAVWGNLGGYPGIRTDYSNFYWDGLIAQLHAILSPINTTVLGTTLAQVVGALSSLGILVGLAVFGRRWIRFLLVAGAWMLLVLLPVLNLPVKADDLQQNRLLYLASAGYCMIAAALLYSAIVATRRWRGWVMSLVGLLLLLSIATCWVQLRPWHTATVQANELEEELLRLIPPPATGQSNVMTWYTEDSPHDYKGAYLVHLALGMPRYFTGRQDVPVIREVRPATEAPLASDAFDSFALRIDYHENEMRFHVGYAAGITTGGPPPSAQEAGDGLLVWNFSDCAADVVDEWRVASAQGSCEPGAEGGLILRNSTGDPQLLGPPVDLQPLTRGARFVRLRVSVRYPAQPETETAKSQWFWHGSQDSWSEERSQELGIRQDGVPHVYWTFVPSTELENSITGLRFDPADNKSAAAIQWIAVDMVK